MSFETLHCPHCGFAKAIAVERLPAEGARVRCPRCREAFSWQRPELDFGFQVVELRYGGFWRRLLAFAVDGVVLYGLCVGFAVALQLTVPTLVPEMTGPLERALAAGSVMSALVLVALYFVGLTGAWGATAGKALLKLQVRTVEGAPAGYSRALLRELLGKSVSLLFGGLGFITIGFDSRKQGIHDKLAGTVVCSTQTPRPAATPN